MTRNGFRRTWVPKLLIIAINFLIYSDLLHPLSITALTASNVRKFLVTSKSLEEHGFPKFKQ